jgi:hypothetical protein
MFSMSTRSPSPLVEATMTKILADEAKRKAVLARAWRGFYGEFPPPLNVTNNGPNDNIIVNLLKPIVNATVYFLFGQQPVIEIPIETDGEGNIATPSAAEKWLKECFRVNHWPSFLQDLGINGAVCGTPYARISTTDPVPNPMEPARPFPKLHVVDPANMTMRWSPKDIDLVTSYIWEFNNVDDRGAPILERQLVRRENNGTWTILDQHKPLTGDVRDYVTDDTTTWPYQWPPFIHAKNLPNPNQPYGAPDITDGLIKLNRTINFNLSNRNRIDRLHGHPKPWIKGMQGQIIDFNATSVIDIPSEKGEIGQLVPAVDSGPAKMLGDDEYEYMVQESQTPSLVMGKTQTGTPPSGTALRVALWPIDIKTETKKTLYEPLIVELCRRLLQLGGFGANILVNVTWPDMIPSDPEAERRVAIIDEQLGIDPAKIVEKLGWDPENDMKDTSSSNAGAALLAAFTNEPGKNVATAIGPIPSALAPVPPAPGPTSAGSPGPTS